LVGCAGIEPTTNGLKESLLYAIINENSMLMKWLRTI
jgi:hypothetical protein